MTRLLAIGTLPFCLSVVSCNCGDVASRPDVAAATDDVGIDPPPRDLGRDAEDATTADAGRDASELDAAVLPDAQDATLDAGDARTPPDSGPDASCEGGLTACPRDDGSYECVDLSCDVDHCGSCEAFQCGVCFDSHCGDCGDGTVACDIATEMCGLRRRVRCVPLDYDREHCGRCNNRCPDGWVCGLGASGGGECQIPPDAGTG